MVIKTRPKGIVVRDVVICLIIWSVLCVTLGYKLKEYESKEYLKRNKFIVYEKHGPVAVEGQLSEHGIEKLSGMELK